jgi:quercetin dioxygenase-like cupin family protein
VAAGSVADDSAGSAPKNEPGSTMKVTNVAVPPGERLGKHVDTAEETQVVFSGEGELLLDDGARPIKHWDVDTWPPDGTKVTGSPNRG